MPKFNFSVELYKLRECFQFLKSRNFSFYTGSTKTSARDIEITEDIYSALFTEGFHYIFFYPTEVDSFIEEVQATESRNYGILYAHNPLWGGPRIWGAYFIDANKYTAEGEIVLPSKFYFSERHAVKPSEYMKMIFAEIRKILKE